MTYLKSVIKKSEQDIKNNWRSTTMTPLVSISCITYNHEKYIHQSIDGMLMQETTFPFEILIHDDASTDRTPEIIKSYQSEYPNIIKPIYQIENQYSKGSDIVSYNFSRAKGEYIALCEGDDFSIDKDKLQYQIDKMKNHENCNISFHPAKIVFDQKITNGITSRHLDHDTIFDIKEVIKGDGGFCPTVSVIIKKVVTDNLPFFFKTAPVGDYFIQIFGALESGALYIDRTMSAYRKHDGGIWTSKQKSFDLIKTFALDMSVTLKEMDEFFNYQYHNEIIFVMSNIYLTIINNSSYPVDNRIDLYHDCKDYLTKEQQIKQLQYFIDERDRIAT